MKYSETFFSPQGEGKYSGHPSVWLRFAGCNLRCHGFGQEDPTDRDTYILDFKEYDPVEHNITCIEELPVWTRGCDSSYCWAPKFAHLLREKSVSEMCDELEEHMTNAWNEDGKFYNPHSQQHNHLCFTGGESMENQDNIIAIVDEFYTRGNMPAYITIETNTTIAPTEEFTEAVYKWADRGLEELFFSCSPKLWSVAGEKPQKAIKPSVMKAYYNLYQQCDDTETRVNGQIKIVANNTDRTWEEFESAVSQFRAAGVHWPVYAMPVGATVEEQEVTAGDIAVEACKRGYIVCARIHTYLFGNAIGT